MSGELLPCPFCGGEGCCSPSTESSEPEKEDREPIAWGVGCSCTAFMGPWSTEAEAIAAWNQRTRPDELIEALEKIADIEPDPDNMGRFHDIAQAALAKWGER